MTREVENLELCPCRRWDFWRVVAKLNKRTLLISRQSPNVQFVSVFPRASIEAQNHFVTEHDGGRIGGPVPPRSGTFKSLSRYISLQTRIL